MKQHGPTARAAILAGVALAVLGAAACTKKVTTVDANFTAPEGVASSGARLVVWREAPNQLYIFKRAVESDPPEPDTLEDSLSFSSGVPGQLHGAILDSTAASAYQVYRREPNGGALGLYDFTSAPARRWLDRGWETYHFVDPDTSLPSHTYRGRGVVGGVVTLSSPLTNEASDTVRAVAGIAYTGQTGFDPAGDASPLDSLFLMEWETVPNAAGYLIHVYQPGFNLITAEENILSGMPAPLFIGKSRDILVAYLPAPSPPGPTVSFRMPSPGARPPEARVMTVRETRFGQEYRVRIAAVDAFGQLLAYTPGNFSQRLTGLLPGGRTLPGTHYAVFRLGGVRVVPSRPTPPVPRARARRP